MPKPNIKLKTPKPTKEIACLRCGMTKKELRKEYWACSQYGKYFKRHIFLKLK